MINFVLCNQNEILCWCSSILNFNDMNITQSLCVTKVSVVQCETRKTHNIQQIISFKLTVN